MTTRVTEGARRERHDKRETLFFLLGLPSSFLASRGFAAQRSRARVLPLLNLKKKRGCSKILFCRASPLSRLQSREGVICVFRAICSTDQEKRETARSLLHRYTRRSVSDGFLYTLETCLVNFELP